MQLPFEGSSHWIEKLHSFGIRDVVINVHPLAEVVVEPFWLWRTLGYTDSIIPENRNCWGPLELSVGSNRCLRFLVIYADNQSK